MLLKYVDDHEEGDVKQLSSVGDPQSITTRLWGCFIHSEKLKMKWMDVQFSGSNNNQAEYSM